MPPNESIKVTARGHESGYVATLRILLQCALVVLNNKDQGYFSSGALTPSTAFWRN